MNARRTIKIWGAVLFGLAVIAGCKYEPLEGTFVTDDDSLSHRFKALVDGVAFETNTATASTAYDQTSIRGSLPDGSRIELIARGDSVATYNFADTLQNRGIVVQAGDPRPYSSKFENDTGQITISDYNKTAGYISGNFNFAAQRTVNDEQTGEDYIETVIVTSGEFELVPLEVSDVEVPGDSQMIATVDGDFHFASDLLTVTENAGITTINGDHYDEAFISLRLPTEAEPGAYELGVDDVAASYHDFDEGQTYAGVGFISVIDNNEDLFQATFSFHAVDDDGETVHEVTDGYVVIYHETEE